MYILYSLVFLSLDGRVFSWGKNTTSQLGHSKGLSRVLAPTQITHLVSTPVIKLICGSNHSAALTVSGGVFLWGDNRYHSTVLVQFYALFF